MPRKIKTQIALAVQKVVRLPRAKEIARKVFVQPIARQRPVALDALIHILRKASLRFQNIEIKINAVVHAGTQFHAPLIEKQQAGVLIGGCYIQVQDRIYPQVEKLVIHLQKIRGRLVEIFQNRLVATHVPRILQAGFRLRQELFSGYFFALPGEGCVKFRGHQPLIVVAIDIANIFPVQFGECGQVHRVQHGSVAGCGAPGVVFERRVVGRPCAGLDFQAVENVVGGVAEWQVDTLRSDLMHSQCGKRQYAEPFLHGLKFFQK